jgi:hypothetical protein
MNEVRPLVPGVYGGRILSGDRVAARQGITGTGVTGTNDRGVCACNLWIEIGVPYGSRTRVAAVKEKRFAAWIALHRT